MIIKKIKSALRRFGFTKSRLRESIKPSTRDIFIRDRYNQRKISTRLFS